MKNNKPRFPFESGRKNFDFLFLTALGGLILFKLFFSFYFHWSPETKNGDFISYCLGWILVPGAGWALTRLLEKIRDQWLEDKPSFYVHLALVHFILVLFLFHPRWSSHLGPFAQFGVFLFMETAGLWTAGKCEDHSAPPPEDAGGGRYLAMIGLSVFWIFNLTPNLGGFVINHPLHFLVFFGVVYAFHWGIPKISSSEKNTPPGNSFSAGILRPLLAADTAILLGTAYLLIDPHFTYEKPHFSFYLGPLADLINGKSLLNNINAQYGVLVFYFLKFFFHFLPLGYTSFSLVGTALTTAEYFLFYFICRNLFKGWALPLFCLTALLLLNHFAATGTNPAIFPSTGPLRFGFFYLLGALLIMRNRFPRWKNIFYMMEAAVIGTAVFWGFEVFIYTVPAYLVLLVHESFWTDRVPGFDRNGFWKRMLFLACAILAAGGFLYGDIFRRTGEWPHWSYYFDFILAYQEGVGALPLPEISYWSILIAVLYVSLFCVGWVTIDRFRNKKNLPTHFNVIVLTLFYGMAQFLYYLWRSHPSNLFHICAPSLLLASYWLYSLRHFETPSVPRVFRGIGFSLAVLFIGIYLQKTIPFTLYRLQRQIVPLNQWVEGIRLATQDLPREDGFAEEAWALMEKYSKGKKRLVYFFGEQGLELSMYKGISKVYPYNDLTQASLCLPVLLRILQFDPQVQKGDFIYISNDSQWFSEHQDINTAIAFEYHLLRKIRKNFELTRVDQKNGISVYQVGGPISGNLPSGRSR